MSDKSKNNPEVLEKVSEGAGLDLMRPAVALLEAAGRWMRPVAWRIARA